MVNRPLVFCLTVGNGARQLLSKYRHNKSNAHIIVVDSSAFASRGFTLLELEYAIGELQVCALFVRSRLIEPLKSRSVYRHDYLTN
jgi:hypothetical protein